ncbi:hypothetical protein WJX73_006146 [Symbiochloris irregularis]|uniref:Amino acid permease n=1 Tax=Symbiochloris irregularis TaxID=706552 RepID=A0AAW1NSW9_9CHLO
MPHSPSDDKLLAQLGLSQVFKRELHFVHNFCISFLCICAAGSLTSTLTLAWNSGGPAACIYGWLLSSLACCALGLAMAEITSALPTCGGPYYWASVLGRERGPLLGWFSGWFSLIGEAALAGAYAASVSALLVNLASVNHEVNITPAQQLGIYTGGAYRL